MCHMRVSVIADLTTNVTEYSPAKLGNIRAIFPSFQNRAICEKYLKDNKHNSLYLARTYVYLIRRFVV